MGPGYLQGTHFPNPKKFDMDNDAAALELPTERELAPITMADQRVSIAKVRKVKYVKDEEKINRTMMSGDGHLIMSCELVRTTPQISPTLTGGKS